MATSPGAPAHLAGGKPAEHGDFLLRRRYRLVRRLLEPRGGVLLDLGCGNGAQTELFAPGFDLVVGADVEPSFLHAFAHTAEPAGRPGSTIALCYDGHRLPLRDASVDFAISFEVLEHVQSEHDVLSELRRVLRPSGELVMSVPNRWWVFETHGAELPLLPWNRVPFFSWLPKTLHDRWARARIYRRREIVRLLSDHGFQVERAVYLTAPMDVVRWAPLRRALRATLFKSDDTSLPMLSTAILLVAHRA